MKYIINLIKIVVSGMISLILLSGFCLLFNYTGCHITNKDGSTDYKWESNQFFSTMKEGFAWFHFDKNGFNNVNDISFEEVPVDILLMGSSHMEAVQLKPSESTAALLNNQLPEYRTYNIGISGHNIYTCIKNMQTACDRFKPRKFVILETNSVQLNIASMNLVTQNSFPEIPSHDSGLIYKVQKTVPSIKSLYKSITDWISSSSQHGSNLDSAAGNVDKNVVSQSLEYEKTLNEFLHKASISVPTDCELIIFYHPVTVIDSNGNYCRSDSAEVILQK